MLSKKLPPKTYQRIGVVTWNIHDIYSKTEGLKTEDEDFLKIISSHLIFCLQETKRKVTLPDFRCFNKLRVGSRSGGLCMGIHKSLAASAKEIKVKSQDIQVVTLEFPSRQKGHIITLFNVYDSPEESSYKKKKALLGDF